MADTGVIVFAIARGDIPHLGHITEPFGGFCHVPTRPVVHLVEIALRVGQIHMQHIRAARVGAEPLHPLPAEELNHGGPVCVGHTGHVYVRGVPVQVLGCLGTTYRPVLRFRPVPGGNGNTPFQQGFR